MIIGIDFDNTIIDYNNLFYSAWVSLGILPRTPVPDKKTIRHILVETGREDDWIRIQGLVYGKYIQDAKTMEGFPSFLDLCKKSGWTVFIISHKTRETILGERFNLHDAARIWLEKNNIFGPGIRSPVRGVFFELTREEKISRINQLNCNVIIDDLIEVLTHPGLTKDVEKILFNPMSGVDHQGFATISNWNRAHELIAGQYG